MILVVAELQHGQLSRATFDAIAAAQALSAAMPAAAHDVMVAVYGSHPDAAADALRRAEVARVVVVDDPALAMYRYETSIEVCSALVDRLSPRVVVLPHSYQTRDFAPRLAARRAMTLVTDVVGVEVREGHWIVKRPMFQGRLIADVPIALDATSIVTVQVGAFRHEAAPSDHEAPVETCAITLAVAAEGSRPEPPFREAQQSVDLSKAERIVSVGRGIKDESHIALARELAEAMGAELAASRPICDAGWLPMTRQVGSSGQTVAPRLYVALGISGAIQHVVGMKGAEVVVAINRDPGAPIFELARYGIVGDLFDVVPAIIAALKR